MDIRDEIDRQKLDMKKYSTLTEVEQIIVDWRFDMTGDFRKFLFEAIGRADRENITKLAAVFPEEVAGYLLYTQQDGWWQRVLDKLKKDE